MTKNVGGRPPKPKAELKNELLQIRFTSEEKDILRKAAKELNSEMSEFVRIMTLNAANAIVKDKSRESLAGAMINTANTVINKIPSDDDKKPVEWLQEMLEIEKAKT